MKTLPTGTVTFVFTDIEGSTRLIQRLGAGHREVLETHTHLLRKAISEAGGIEVGERGDGFFFVFVSACDAVKAAAQIQRSLAEHSWPAEATVRVPSGSSHRQRRARWPGHPIGSHSSTPARQPPDRFVLA
jgi:class 3 adenylate cyclase